jgi:hypothetical protein
MRRAITVARESARFHDSTERAGAGGQGDQMTAARGQESEVRGPWSVVGKAIIRLTLCSMLLAPCSLLPASPPMPSSRKSLG